MLRPTASRRAMVDEAGARVGEAGRDARHQLLDRAAARLQAVRHLSNSLVGLAGVLLGALGALLDLAERRRGLLRGGGLLLSAAIDLTEGGHDLARGARQFLDGRRQFLRRCADLFGRPGVDLAGARLLGGARQLLRRRLALFERLGLLLDRGLGFVGAPTTAPPPRRPPGWRLFRPRWRRDRPPARRSGCPGCLRRSCACRRAAHPAS